MPEKLSFCRFCHAFCGIKVDGRGRPRRQGHRRRGQPDVPRLHLRQGPGAARAAQPPGPAAPLHEARCPTALRGHPGRAGDGRDRRSARATSSTSTARARSRSTPARSRSTTRRATRWPRAFMRAIGSPCGSRRGSIDQPGQGHRAGPSTARWGGGPQPFERVRHVDARRRQPRHLDVGRHPAVQPGEAPARRQGARHEAHRDRPAPHRGGAPSPTSSSSRSRARTRRSWPASSGSSSTRGSTTPSSSPRTSRASTRCASAVEPFTPDYVERRANVPRRRRRGRGRMFAARARAARSPPAPGRTWRRAAR